MRTNWFTERPSKPVRAFQYYKTEEKDRFLLNNTNNAYIDEKDGMMYCNSESIYYNHKSKPVSVNDGDFIVLTHYDLDKLLAIVYDENSFKRKYVKLIDEFNLNG